MGILEELSFKQQKFCEEYLLSFNAYRAAISAGYSENTARKGDLLHVSRIQAYLKAAMGRSAARAELTHDMLLRELMKIAFCNMGNYYDDRGDPKRMHKLTDDEKAAISYYQRADMCREDGYIYGELVKIKLHNKMAALDRLCKHTGFYKANWKPLAEVDRSETAEDIAFEAECGKTECESILGEEVREELLGQMGFLSPESGVKSLESVGNLDAGADAGSPAEDPAETVSNMFGAEDTPLRPSHPDPDSYRGYREGNCLGLNEKGSNENILTFSPLVGNTSLRRTKQSLNYA